jgi:three-Cys-motif partner protein
MEDDGYYLPAIRPHSLEKIGRHDFYADVFTRAMHRKYRPLVYIGLYSGAGKAVIKGTSEIVETSALAVIRQAVPFTRYIFVDSDRRCIEALDHRINALGGGFDVTLIQRPVNDAVPEIPAALPDIPTARREGLLGLCFADPFKVDLDFNVIRALSRYWLDFLVMLPFGFDLRRNLRRYLENEADTSVARLLDATGWREEWRARESRTASS